MKIYYLASEQELLALAQRLAACFRKNDVILLVGPLGVGKTCFVRGAAAYYGCADQVSSPTFVLVNQYEGSGMTLYHFDLYRVADEQELAQTGADELFFAGGVCLVEWPDCARTLLQDAPVSTITIDYECQGRRLTVTGPIEERILDYEDFGN